MAFSQSDQKNSSNGKTQLPTVANLNVKNSILYLCIPGQGDLVIADEAFNAGRTSHAFLVGGSMETAPYVLKYAKKSAHDARGLREYNGLPRFLQDKMKLLEMTVNGKIRPAFLEVNGGENLYNYFENYIQSQDISSVELLKHYKSIINIVLGELFVLHNHGIIHGDFKPDNVLIKLNVLTGVLQATIMDWGLSSLINHEQPVGNKTKRMSSYHMGDEVFGNRGQTFRYSPETDLPGVGHTIEWCLLIIQKYQIGLYAVLHFKQHAHSILALVDSLRDHDMRKRPSIKATLFILNDILTKAIENIAGSVSPVLYRPALPLIPSAYTHFQSDQFDAATLSIPGIKSQSEEREQQSSDSQGEKDAQQSFSFNSLLSVSSSSQSEEGEHKARLQPYCRSGSDQELYSSLCEEDEEQSMLQRLVHSEVSEIPRIEQNAVLKAQDYRARSCLADFGFFHTVSPMLPAAQAIAASSSLSDDVNAIPLAASNNSVAFKRAA